ncbi:MAG: aminomethyltransferase family protein [Acidobacteria bacterium]|nr:aminomethyltransferase family protein [Acidobacteriota bacterium]
MDIEIYNHIRSGGAGYYEHDRGLIAVWGKEAVPFLDGMITNDMKTLEDGQQMLAAFPNAQGRLLAVVRVLRQGERFLIETEGATREKVYQNLFRFTFAGDFFVEDLSAQFRYFEFFGYVPPIELGEGGVRYEGGRSVGCFVRSDAAEAFLERLAQLEIVQISDKTYETLRIENGIPLYGVDMDETTIVPELGLDGLISYIKGCYIGQEIIARIHFRGHVAKQLTGLIIQEPGAIATGSELTSPDGKNAGRITSITFSPKLEKHIALAYVRYEFLGEGTELKITEHNATVKALPFIDSTNSI